MHFPHLPQLMVFSFCLWINKFQADAPGTCAYNFDRFDMPCIKSHPCKCLSFATSVIQNFETKFRKIIKFTFLISLGHLHAGIQYQLQLFSSSEKAGKLWSIELLELQKLQRDAHRLWSQLQNNCYDEIQIWRDIVLNTTRAADQKNLPLVCNAP